MKGSNMNTRLTRNPNNTMIAGVASGLADYFGIDPTIVRLLFLLLLLPGGLSPLIYVVFWIVMPERALNGPGGAEPYRFDPSSGAPLDR
jgi:phage shock protein C